MSGQMRLDDVILQILREEERGFAFHEIKSALLSLGIKVTDRGIRAALSRLIAQGAVFRTRGADGRPIYVAVPSLERFMTETIRMERKDEITEAVEEREQQEWAAFLARRLGKMVEEFGGLVDLYRRLEKGLERAAAAMASEDPHSIFFEFAKWLERRFREIQEAKPRNGARILRIIARIIFDVFARGLSIPYSGRRDLKPRAPITIRFSEAHVFDSGKTFLEIDEEGLREFLRRRVFGRAFVERIPLRPAGDDFVTAGLDSSHYIVDPLAAFRKLLNISLPWFPLHINAATTVWVMGLAQNRPPIIDARPEPGEVLGYESERAERLGWLVRPDTIMQQPEMEDRIREAAMDILELRRIYEAFYPDPFLEEERGWISEPSLIFRDGRIFPYEHTMDDYIHEPPHGRFVRTAILEFNRVLDTATLRKDRTLLLGVVKRPGISYLAQTLVWYAYTRRFINITEDELWRVLARPPRTDDEVFLMMARSLGGEAHEALVSVRVVRRFYAMDPDLVELLVEEWSSYDDENHEKFWLAALHKRLRARAYIPPMEQFARLCAEAAVLMFYYVPVSLAGTMVRNLRLPRRELLLPAYFVRLSKDEVEDYERDLVGSSLIDDYVMYSEETRGPVLMVDLPVKLAHEECWRLARQFQRDLADLLRSRLAEFLGTLWRFRP